MQNILSQNYAKWKLDELESLINSFDELMEQLAKERQIKIDQDYPNLLLQLAGKTIVTTREIICLVANGFAEGAISISRSMYEILIIAKYLSYHCNDKDFNSIIDDYYLDYYKSHNRMYKYLANATGSNELLASINHSTQQHSNSAHHKYNNGDYWWTGYRTFNSLVDNLHKSINNKAEKDLLIRCHFLYRKACLYVHPNCYGNIWRLKYGDVYTGIDTCPSICGHGLPLELTSIALLYITCIISEFFGLDYTIYQNGFNSLASYYTTINNNEEKDVLQTR